MRLLFIDGSTKLVGVRDLDIRARGGMVTSLFKITDYLANRGHDVTVLSDIQIEGQTNAGVKWFRNCYNPDGYDVLVCNRGTHDGYPQIHAQARVLWTHDLPHAGFIPSPQTIRAFACTVFMSEYAERIWRAFYRDIGASELIPNGVDKSIFFPREKNRDYLIYASAPNRGLKQLPFIFDAIQAAIDRPLKCRAFSNLAALHPGEGEDTFDYESIRKSKVELCAPIPQKDFSEEIGRAGLMILPTDYPEICSNSILQSLASGTPIITTGNLGSAPEWIQHDRNGKLTKFQAHDYMIYTMEMVRNAVEVLSDERLHRRMIDSKQAIHDWDEIGAKWEKMLNKL